jgi:hypothetical protein
MNSTVGMKEKMFGERGMARFDICLNWDFLDS